MKNYFIEKGEGEPLLLLHGNGEDHTYFEHQMEYFSKMYRVIALDTRGHGKSERGNKPFTIVQFAQDLYDFLEEQKIEKAHILGFSDGGNIALTLALNHPEKVNKLILNGANLFPGGVKKIFQIPIEIEYRLTRNQKKKDLLGLMVKEPNIHPEELHSLFVPTLVIAGKKDVIQDKHTRLIAQSLPNAQLEIMDGDHFIASKEHQVFNKIVENFLK